MKHHAFQWALTTTLALRIGISAILAAGWTAIRPFISASLDQLGINPLFPVSYSKWGEAFLGIWNRYDGYRYFLLAYSGYQDPTNIANTVFYPLYPMILRGLWKLTGFDLIAISLFVSTVTAFFAFFMLYLTVDDIYGEKAAKYTVVCLAVYPTSLFLVGPYTESLFIALTLAAFYMARKDHWLLAGLAGALASLTRGPGVFTAFALAWMAIRNWRQMQFTWTPKVLHMAVGVAAPGLAGIGFMLWRQWMGFPSTSEILAEHFGVRLVNPISGLYNGLRMMFINPTVTIVLEGLTAILWISLLILIIRKWKQFPVEWIIYYGLNLLMVTSKVTTIISPQQSIGRYILILFPGFVYLGTWLSGLQPRKRFAYIVVSSALLVTVCALYVIGFFVG